MLIAARFGVVNSIGRKICTNVLIFLPFYPLYMKANDEIIYQHENEKWHGVNGGKLLGNRSREEEDRNMYVENFQ